MIHQLKIPLLCLMLLTFGMAQAQTDIFYESFDTNKSTGGNDGQWSGGVASAKIDSDNEGWTFVTAYGANYCARFGSSKNAGSATTPALSLLNGDATLTFKAGSWAGDNTTLTLSISGGGSLSQTSFALKDSEFETYTVDITGGTSVTTIKFEGAAKKRFFLDEVRVSGESGPQKVEVSSITQLRQQESGTLVRLTLSEANQGNIEYIYNGTTIDAYVRDNGAAVRFANFLPNDAGWHTVTGGALIGAVDGEYRITDGIPEFVHISTSIADSILCLDYCQTPTPIVVDNLATLTQDTYRADYIMMEGVNVVEEDGHYSITNGEKKVSLTNPFNTEFTFPSDLRGRHFDIYGILGTQNKGTTSALYYTEIEEVMPQLALDETRYNNLTAIGIYHDREVKVNVARKLTTGMWNTLCLPFDIYDFSDIVGAARIAQFTGYNASTNSLEFTSVENITAGVPYLIYPEEDIEQISLSDVTINSQLTPVTYSTYEMVGIYDPTTLYAGDTQTLFLGSNNTLYYPNVDNDLKAFRAYFRTSTGNSANICVDGVMTDITTVQIDMNEDGGRIYNVSGQFVGTSADTLQKGVYVRRGNKLIIK